jgi:hypothetical protein
MCHHVFLSWDKNLGKEANMSINPEKGGPNSTSLSRQYLRFCGLWNLLRLTDWKKYFVFDYEEQVVGDCEIWMIFGARHGYKVFNFIN